VNEPTAILVAGDWHGDPQHAGYIMERAINQDVQAIVQVGDFGYWEHMNGGAEFLDWCSDIAIQNAMPIYWIDGNHENHTMLRAVYGPGGERHDPTPEGFWQIRPGLFYIPRGTRWEWNGIKMMGLGGAYSVDKDYRLRRTAQLVANAHEKNQYRRRAGAPVEPFDPASFAMWWPEEEINDEELAHAIGDGEPVDILFTHDKPKSANPPWNRKAYPECQPNAARIQTVVESLHVKMVVHGHLHFRYTDYIHNGTEDGYCVVEGLDCNAEAEGNPERSWMRVELLINPLDTDERYESIIDDEVYDDLLPVDDNF
jgi:hypothetical protein